jgi:DNA-binding SARP family transcriptional activator
LASAGDHALRYEALLDAGWPGERVFAAAARKRVRSAIATLRALGLRDLLVTTGDGYMLDARTVLAHVAA